MRSENTEKKSPMSFTLIELLVVVTIIIVLCSMLLPAIHKAKEYSRMLACKNNERQVGLSNFLYSSDYNGYCIPNRGDINTSATIYWCVVSYEYTKEPYVFICPSHPGNKERLEVYNTSSGWQLTQYRDPDYGYNWIYVGTSYGKGFTTWPYYGPPARLSELRNPGATVCFAESVKIGTGTDYRPERGYYQVSWKMDNLSSVAARHTNGGNVFYGDGHCEYKKTDMIFSTDPSDDSKKELWDLN